MFSLRKWIWVGKLESRIQVFLYIELTWLQWVKYSWSQIIYEMKTGDAYFVDLFLAGTFQIDHGETAHP